MILYLVAENEQTLYVTGQLKYYRQPLLSVLVLEVLVIQKNYLVLLISSNTVSSLFTSHLPAVWLILTTVTTFFFSMNSGVYGK